MTAEIFLRTLGITVDGGKNQYSCPSVSMLDWFQDSPQIPKFEDAQVPYIK